MVEGAGEARVRHIFGSSETERKLDCLRGYLTAYSIALSKQNFARVYIDAFAGTGDRTETRAVLPSIFGASEASIEEITTPGSARIAIDTIPAFHSIALIENDPGKVSALRRIADEYPDRQIHIREGDANAEVQRICNRYSWRRERMRGVIFLDPYGMEVSWSTVETIAATQALDCWYFFPLSGLYRNAPKDPLKFDQIKINSLNRVFGTDSWRQDWYASEEPTRDLLGDLFPREKRIADVDTIEKWVHARLGSVFKGTVLPPLRLKHANGAPMASLFFAVSNPSKAAVKVARDIASYILKAGI